MSTLGLEIILGALAIFTGLIGQIRAIAGWFAGLFVCEATLDVDVSAMIIRYLTRNRRSLRRRPYFIAAARHSRQRGSKEQVVFEGIGHGHSLLLFDGAVPVHMSSSMTSHNQVQMTMRFFRGTSNTEALITRATTWCNDQETAVHQQSRFRVVHHGEDNDPLGGMTNGSSFPFLITSPAFRAVSHDGAALRSDVGVERDIILPPQSESVLLRARQWMSARDWYAKRGIPWRLGFMFEGAPGTGKTLLGAYLARQLSIPIHTFDLGSMSSHEFVEAWDEMTRDTPCIVLFEDLDGVYEGRKTVTSGPSFDVLLNKIDGVEQSDGVLLIVTTNHIAGIDPALRDRPGRIDEVVHFGPMTSDDAVDLMTRVTGDRVWAMGRVAELGDVPAARVMEAACAEAVKRLYASNAAAVASGELRREVPSKRK